MNYDRYEFVRVHKKLNEFRFHSIGPNGMVEMVIQFQRINFHTYNLAFGKATCDDRIDDSYSVRNLDRDKILSTVAAAVFEFTAMFPDRFVYFCSDCPVRSRLYRMAIGNNLEELTVQFEILGVRELSPGSEVEEFVKNISYVEFFAKRKPK